MYGLWIEISNVGTERGRAPNVESDTHLFVEERANPEFQPPVRHASVSGKLEEDVEMDRLEYIITSAYFLN